MIKPILIYKNTESFGHCAFNFAIEGITPKIEYYYIHSMGISDDNRFGEGGQHAYINIGLIILNHLNPA